MAMMADSDDDTANEDGVSALLSRTAELKQQGNTHFKAGNLNAAQTAYIDGISRLTSNAAKKALREWWSHSGTEDTATPLLVSLHTNLAAVHVKLEQWEAAITAATSALTLDSSSVKARFRRGVACSRIGQMQEAKADLTAVAKADPKNREARTVLEVVNAALAEQTTSEKARYSKAFAGKSLYADEEAKAEAAKAAEAATKAAEEAALLQEWRDECDRLRAEMPINATAALLASAASKGDSEARTALDCLAPISLKAFGDQKLAKAQKEKEARGRKAAEARQSAGRARSDVSRLEAEDDDEAALLSELGKGYKTRADGSKTSYFDRSEHVDASTKAMLDAQKAPKKLGAVEAAAVAAATGPGGGSAWNAAGTWEERDMSAWARSTLAVKLAGALGTASCTAQLDGEVEGSASIISMRGRVKRPFELKFCVKWEVRGAGAASSAVGKLSYTEVSPAAAGATKPVIYEVVATVTTAPTIVASDGVDAELVVLKQQVDEALFALAGEFMALI